ncbi:hypothetical protein BTH42_09830 [Burkholderia sp. SRS-W-2-2016]|uniref:hypothetical protein n=1 Tax=Burkholderia sp. SRS-W-2-2016 TaxID=1926878 RepID=UPI00094ABF13|nr:hypothetical protein [Burkholderia sp. SRS-W-2-2016]OLL31918.1 hypothetical protein BTH42_09830 [Burkholderia sp. SRS-W-2-2016]
MALTLTQSLDRPAVQSATAQQVQRSNNNVIPFRSTRALLHVVLPVPQLRVLLHSPLGVYVVGTETVRGEIRAQLDIAREDLDFTLHTLLATLPAATIGALTRRVSTSAAITH